MSKAHKMFKALGFRKIKSTIGYIDWVNDNDDVIVFSLKHKYFWATKAYTGLRTIPLNEFMAIIEFAKELGWITNVEGEGKHEY